MKLDAGERRELLRVARGAIEEHLGRAGAGAAIDLTPGLLEPRGVFVTLRVPGPAESGVGVLRGCIGSLASARPLHEEVGRNAVAAAFHDPRFPPLRPEELDAVRLSVSALTPVRPVDGPSEIVVGRHGVVLVLGDRSAVFLPEVAVDQGWDRTALLRNLARKAGLDANAWRGASFRVFETESFSEGEKG